MGNWGRSRNGQLLTPKRLKLIRAYYERRLEYPWSSRQKWTKDEIVAYRKWRDEFMKEPRRAKKAHRRPTKG